MENNEEKIIRRRDIIEQETHEQDKNGKENKTEDGG